MSHFYFVRHGQTIWNAENKICGATDIALTQQGIEQAKVLGEEIVREGYHIDEILYSPLMRAADTAACIAEATGIPKRVEPRLTEQNFGRYESTARDGEEFALIKRNMADHFGGGESMLQLAQRVYNLLDEIRQEPDKVYLLVAHNGIARMIDSYFHDMSNAEFADFGLGNCEIRRYDFDDKPTFAMRLGSRQRSAIKLTTLCYLEQDEKYLMLYRNKKQTDQSHGKWLGIGGKFLPGEIPDACMSREVTEETGLTVTDFHFHGVISFISDIWEDEYMFLYSSHSFSGTLKTDCDEGTLQWIPKDEILSLSLWEGDRIFLQDLMEGKSHINMKLIYQGDRLVQVER